MKVRKTKIVSLLVVIAMLFSMNITLLTCAAEEVEEVIEEFDEMISEIVEEVFEEEIIEEEIIEEEIIEEEIIEEEIVEEDIIDDVIVEEVVEDEITEDVVEEDDVVIDEPIDEAIPEVSEEPVEDADASEGEEDASDDSADVVEEDSSETDEIAPETSDDTDSTEPENEPAESDETKEEPKAEEATEGTEKEELLDVELSLVESEFVVEEVYDVRSYVYLAVDQVVAEPGKYVTVNISLSENLTGVRGMCLYLTYDEALELIDVDQRNALSYLDLYVEDYGSEALLIWEGYAADYSEGVIATLTFYVSPDAKTGEQYIDIFYDEGDIFDEYWDNLGALIEPGYVYVMSSKPVRPTVAVGEYAIGTVYDESFNTNGRSVVSVYLSEEESGKKTVTVGSTVLYYNEQADRYVGMVYSSNVTGDSLKSLKIANTAPETFVYGNVDGDDDYATIQDAIDVVDLQILKKFVKGKQYLSTKQLLSSDLDGDGLADSSDLQALKKYLKSGKKMEFGVLN